MLIRVAAVILVVFSCAVLLEGCANTAPRATAPPQQSTLAKPAASAVEQPLPAESNPAGDIPDNQAFVTYHSTSGGYEISAPEGWARSAQGTSVTFTDKYNGEKVTIAAAKAAPAASAADPELLALQKSGRAVRITSIRKVQLPGGPAVLVDFTSNSEPNAVTGKRVRLENNSYLLFHNGSLAVLTLSGPLGSDNVDQWLHIARSFRQI